METVSVRELAKELGISKQAIHKRTEQLPPEFQPEKVDGVYELTPRIADAIRDSKKQATTVNQPQVDEVDVLNRQISDLKEDKKQLYRQLDQYQKLLDQQQQLTLQSNQQIHQLQLARTEEVEDPPNQTKASPVVPKEEAELNQPPTKKGFFNRLFNK